MNAETFWVHVHSGFAEICNFINREEVEYVDMKIIEFRDRKCDLVKIQAIVIYK